jgi:hypothetical protein
MSSVAARPAQAQRFRAGSLAVVLTVVGLIALTVISLVLRTRALRAGFWIDEGLSVGLATRDLFDIPGVLRMDGSPPLYYMLLHVWMAVFGSGEGATHGLSVVFAVLCVPAAWWGARGLSGTRAAWMAAVLAAFHPFLTFYAQETRMYALAALLALLFAACWARAYALGDRRFLIPTAVAGALLLYTHNWAIFLLAGSVAGLAALWWRAPDRRALLRDGALAYGGIALLYAAWVPTLLSQAAHTGAPWAVRPGAEQLLAGAFTAMGGGGGGPLLLIVAGAGVAALLGRPLSGVAPAMAPVDAERRARVALGLAVMLACALLAAWVASQVSPAWTNRYLAVFVGPVVLLGGIGLAHTRALGLAALAVLVFLWADPRTVALTSKSNVRDVAASIEYRPVTTGDLVISTHPEQIAVLHYYLGDRFRYATSLGPQDDPRYLDWTDATDRLLLTPPTPTARELVDRMQPGQAVILVQPILRSYRWNAPWTRLVKRRSREWERALNADPRLRRVESFPRFGLRPPPRGVRAVLYRVRPAPPAT